MDSLESPHDKPIKVSLYEVQRTTFVLGPSAALGLLSQSRVDCRLWGYCTAVVLGLKQAAAGSCGPSWAGRIVAARHGGAVLHHSALAIRVLHVAAPDLPGPGNGGQRGEIRVRAVVRIGARLEGEVRGDGTNYGDDESCGGRA
jgi:hypothetical protein